MKQNTAPILLRRTVAACTALIALAGVSAQAQTPGADLNAAISLASSSTITQGEPVILRYSIKNEFQATRFIGMREDCSNWLSLSLVDASGHAVAGRSVPTARQQDSGNSFGSLTSNFSTPGLINAHSTLEGYVVASQWFPTQAAGRYTLVAHVHLFYRVVAASAPADGEVSAQDISFPLTIAKADTARLRSTGQNLEKTILRLSPAEPVAKRNILINALFSMPSAQAAPSWQALLSDPSSSFWVLSEAVEDLVWLKPADAPDILMGMLLKPGPTQDKHITSAVINGMARVYRGSNPLLRQHIRALYASHGEPLSEIVLAPGRADGN